MALDDPSIEIARLRSLPVPAPPAWTAGDDLPKVVAALDVAWGKIKSGEEEEEVAVAVAVGFKIDARGGGLDGDAPPLFVEFEPREGLLRGPFPPYEAGKLFSREGPRLLVPLMKRLIDGSAAEEQEEAGEEEGRGNGATTTTTTTTTTTKTSAAAARRPDDEEEDEEKKKKPPFPRVDLFLVDGFGELHPERFGCACALGAAAGGAPTAGVAKAMLFLGEGGASPHEREARRRPGGGGVGGVGGGRTTNSFVCPSSPGMETWPLGNDGNGGPLAVAMRPAGRGGRGEGGEEVEEGEEAEEASPPPPSSSSFSPLPLLPGRAAFVSAGHGVPLRAAARTVLACYDSGRRFRIPEPSRAADRLGRRRLREALLLARGF